MKHRAILLCAGAMLGAQLAMRKHEEYAPVGISHNHMHQPEPKLVIADRVAEPQILERHYEIAIRPMERLELRELGNAPKLPKHHLEHKKSGYTNSRHNRKRRW